MSRNIVLTDGQDGYEAVSKYVIEYWKNVCYATVLVTLETSSDGKNYRRTNEIVSPYEWECEYLHDWWEGEPYIKVLGIKDIYRIDILPAADAVEVVRCKDCIYCDKLDVVDVCRHPKNIIYDGSNTKRVHVLAVGEYHYCGFGGRREK